MALRPLEAWLAHLVDPEGNADEVFLRPHAEPALIAADSVSWRVFKNPLAVFVGGVTAVLLQLAEPRVGTGVWQTTSFREEPIRRLRRTAHAAMLTVYGPRSRAQAMIEGVNRLHARLHGTAHDGRTFRGDDPELLDWVHATACFGFVAAYDAYVRPLAPEERDAFYRENSAVARLWGAHAAPASEAALEALFARMAEQLERSDVVFEFLAIVRRMPLLPTALRPLQRVLIDAAIALVPTRMRDRLGLHAGASFRRWQRPLVAGAGAAAERLVWRGHPALLACRRLGLPEAHLFASR